MNLCDVVGYAFDVCFAWLYLGKAAPGAGVPLWRRLAGAVVLLLTFPLYPSGWFAILTNSWLRFGVRVLLYSGFLLLARRISVSLALYDAAFLTAVCTITHNAFLTPLTMPILNTTVQFSAVPLLNGIICAAIVYSLKLLCYAPAYFLVPLAGIPSVDVVRVIALCGITFVSLYIKEVQIPITLNGAAAMSELSEYFIILQVALLVCLLVFEGYQRNLRENTAFRMQQISTEALLKNIREHQQHDAAVRQLRHDLKNHLLSLRVLVEDGRDADALAYIDEYLNRSARSGRLFRTGSPWLDGLMSEKLSAAAEQQIACSVVMDFRDSGFIQPFDLCTILGNALDNAVEACLQQPQDQPRYIDVRGGRKGDCLMVRMANSCAPRADRTALLQTTKADKFAHGFGLGNMKRAVKKYSGLLTAEFEQPDRFVLTVMIPVPHGEPPQ